MNTILAYEDSTYSDTVRESVESDLAIDIVKVTMFQQDVFAAQLDCRRLVAFKGTDLDTFLKKIKVIHEIPLSHRFYQS